MSGCSDEVREVEAEVIEVPAELTAGDRWLADRRSDVEEAATRYTPFEVTSAEAYRDSKRQREALRREIAAIDAERKSMTREVEEAVRRFRDGAKDMLAPLTEAEAAYKANNQAWERRCVESKMDALAARYSERWPDLAAVIPFDRVRERYGAEGKWGNYGTTEAKCARDLDAACERIASDLSTIGEVDAAPDEVTAARADYCLALDLSSALNGMRERRERIEAVRRAEEEAARYAAQGRPEPAPAPPAAAGPEAAPRPAAAPEAFPGAGSRRVLVFEVEVPAEVFTQFKQAMVALGTHGRKVREFNA